MLNNVDLEIGDVLDRVLDIDPGRLFQCILSF
jgi:hypothetical protein